MHRDDRVVLCLALWVGCLGYLAYQALFAWSFRDGLGPDSVTSEGLAAVGRFWTDFRRPLLWSAIPLLTGLLVFPWKYTPDPPEPE